MSKKENARQFVIKVMSREGHTDYTVSSFEEALALCRDQISNHNKWVRVRNADGTSVMVKDITFTGRSVEQIRSLVENSQSIVAFDRITGGAVAKCEEIGYQVQIVDGSDDDDTPTIAVDTDEKVITFNAAAGEDAILEGVRAITAALENGVGSLIRGDETGVVDQQ